MSLIRLTIILAALAWSAPALAQGTPTERVSLSVGMAWQMSDTNFSQSITFEAYAETGSLTTVYTIAQPSRLNVGGVVRLWHGLGAGLAGTSFSGTNPAQISGAIPHPITANQPRTLTGSVDAAHRESALHVVAAYWFRVAPRVDVILSGGPSFMTVQQDFVSDVTYSQTFPYDSVTFESATLTHDKKNVIGGNVGAEVGVRLVSHVGVGGFFRYSRANAAFPDAGVTSVRLGGVEIGGGLHLVF